MGIQQNMSKAMNLLKEQRNLSMSEFADLLEISKSTLQEYLNGSGNPRLSTIDHLAEKLNIDPIILLTGTNDFDKLHIIVLLFKTIKEVAELPEESRRKFAALFVQIIDLWETT